MLTAAGLSNLQEHYIGREGDDKHYILSTSLFLGVIMKFLNHECFILSDWKDQITAKQVKKNDSEFIFYF